MAMRRAVQKQSAVRALAAERKFRKSLIKVGLRFYTGPVSQPWQDHDGNEVPRLRALRQAAGLTLLELSRAVGYSVSHLSNVERGERRASRELISRYEGLSADVHTRPGTDVRSAPFTPAVTWTGGWDYDDFGTRLMRLRLARGWSLAQLAARTKISKSYLGNLEVGRRHPSPAVARACDLVFGESAELSRLAGQRIRPAAAAPFPGDPGNGAPWSGRDPELSRPAGGRLLELRGLAQSVPPRLLLGELAGNARTVASAAAAVQGARGRESWLLAARYAEFTGWMAQEDGQDELARAWTNAAARWAANAGERDMSSYRWERRALIALYRGDACATVELAGRGAEEGSASPRVAGLAIRRQAQGHALAGDRTACLRALDRAAELIARGPAPFPNGESWGPNTISDMSASIEASCLVDLGLHRKAVELFAADPAPAVPAAARTYHRFAVRQAMALFGASEIDGAVHLVGTLLPGLARLDSATLRADLRRLTAAAVRHRGHPQVQILLPDLHNLTRAT